MTAGRRTSTLVPLIAAFTVSVAVVSVHTASPVFWRVSSQAAFLRGDADNVSVDSDGRLLLGPNAETVSETVAPFVWALLTKPDAVWVGSGDDGVVIRIPLNGDEAIRFDVEALNVYALATDGPGDVFAGTAPNGAVVAFDTDGTMRELFKPEETYIWALAAGANGTLYVGTGNPGRIYQIPPGEAATLLYDTGATHVRSLLIDNDGRLVAGTSSPGHVIRVDVDGEAFVLLDSGYDEITAIRATRNGALLAVAANADSNTLGTSPNTAATTVATGSLAGSSTATAVTVSSTSTNPATQFGNKGAVFRIASDGVWDVLWDSNDDTPYDATATTEPSAGIIIGTGPNGKLFHVADEGQTTILLTRAPAQQITRLATHPDGQLYYATANPGRLIRLASDRAGEGTYLSEVHDTGTIATWGTIRWQASTPGDSEIEIFTRSGNTATPGNTWSAWSQAYGDASGTVITSPKARYIQWKAALRGQSDTPVLRSVTTAYLPRNLAPEVTDITVHDAGQVFQQAFASGDPPIAGLDLTREPPSTNGNGSTGDTPAPTLGRQVYRKGLRTFVWTARDLNTDELRFDVLYRPERGGALDDAWRPLKQNTTTTIFTWDTTSVPDGTYVVRVVASDAVSNAPGAMLTGARDTNAVMIDNSPPQIAIETPASAGSNATVTFTVTDAHSPLDRVEYTLDSERWQIVYPLDGISDSLAERFTVTVAADNVGRVVVRATDSMDNASTAGILAVP